MIRLLGILIKGSGGGTMKIAGLNEKIAGLLADELILLSVMNGECGNVPITSPLSNSSAGSAGEVGYIL